MGETKVEEIELVNVENQFLIGLLNLQTMEFGGWIERRQLKI